MGAAVAIVASGLLIADQQEKARADAKKQSDAAAQRQKELADQQAAELSRRRRETDANAARDAARQRQLALTTGAVGPADTILTGPLGLQGQPNLAEKTLLGQ